MAAFTIRPATLADAEALCALHKASVRALCVGAYTTEEIEAWLREREPQGFRRAMTDGGETMLVAEREGAVAGFASIKDATLFGLYVDPARGRGAGRLLLEAAEDQVRRSGAAVLSLQATLNAVPFYRKHGFMRQDRSVVRRGGRDLACAGHRAQASMSSDLARTAGLELAVRRDVRRQPLDDGVDVHAGAVDAGEARRLLVEDHREVGAGEQDRLDAVAPLQLGRDAAQAGGVLVVAALGVEDALVGTADEGDLVGLRLHDLDA